ncbi:MAG TPA: serine/threonine-protein kinase [Vicinamibacterales bacterium]|nr:serine/threonine-protein kinase [Vicinamibacterales bacterium]
MRVLFVAAVAKIAAGLALYPWISGAIPLPARALPSWYYAALLVVFGVSGALLYAGGRQDTRARSLGVVLLIFGTLFTDRLAVRAMPQVSDAVAAALVVLANAPLLAFEPYVFWRFAWSFPRVQSALVASWVDPLITRVALAAGLLLFTVNLLTQGLADAASTLHAAGVWLSPASGGWFWQIVSLLELPSLALLVAKLRAANAQERRRLAWVVVGIVAGTMPMVVHVLLATAIHRYAVFANEPANSRMLGIVLTAFSLIIPAATTYAVVVDQVLEVRFVIRSAVRYALARYTVIALVAVLVAGLVFIAYGNRNRPIGEILSDSPWVIVALAAAAAVLVWRRTILDAIDRRFFREQYDARRILVDLVDMTQKAHTARDIVSLITSEIDRALHLERIALLVRDEETDQLRDLDGRIRSLDVSGPLGSLITGSYAPLDVDLSSASSPLGRLPDAEREWLVDASARLVVPLFGAQGAPLGVLALGDKRSELPFTDEDRKLMMAVAASAALALEQKLQSESPSPEAQPRSRPHAARQCVVCGRVQDRQHPVCRACGNAMRDALLPQVFAGKFEIERQIGAGGMGVVYRARDFTLDRPVAIKVLPRIVPQAAARLRREARAMATMHHANLAVIHAMESWRGAPVLVLEYLSGGTLADRIRYGPIPVSDVITTGVVIGDVLHHVHRAGYLHRDVKPSNIGYTEAGTPKLLDFGLVRLLFRLSTASTATDFRISSPENQHGAAPGDSRSPDRDSSVETAAQQFVGTPAYLSPEAIQLLPATQSVDLWALAVTLYEALTGRNPFLAPTVAETMSLVARGNVADPRDVRADCPAALALFLMSALAADRSARPQSALEFITRLRAVGDSAAV